MIGCCKENVKKKKIDVRVLKTIPYKTMCVVCVFYWTLNVTKQH